MYAEPQYKQHLTILNAKCKRFDGQINLLTKNKQTANSRQVWRRWRTKCVNWIKQSKTQHTRPDQQHSYDNMCNKKEEKKKQFGLCVCLFTCRLSFCHRLDHHHYQVALYAPFAGMTDWALGTNQPRGSEAMMVPTFMFTRFKYCWPMSWHIICNILHANTDRIQYKRRSTVTPSLCHVTPTTFSNHFFPFTTWQCATMCLRTDSSGS